MFDPRNSTTTPLLFTHRVWNGGRHGRIHTQRVWEINYANMNWIIAEFFPFENLEQEEHISCEQMTHYHMERATIRSYTRD